MKCCYGIEIENCIRTDCRYYSVLLSKCQFINIDSALKRDSQEAIEPEKSPNPVVLHGLDAIYAREKSKGGQNPWNYA